jgi:hypothetical protein
MDVIACPADVTDERQADQTRLVFLPTGWWKIVTVAIAIDATARPITVGQ